MGNKTMNSPQWNKISLISWNRFAYHRVQLPQTSPIAWFHPNTATGKLNAVMMPTSPSGFHCSINMWPGPASQIGRRKDRLNSWTSLYEFPLRVTHINSSNMTTLPYSLRASHSPPASWKAPPQSHRHQCTPAPHQSPQGQSSPPPGKAEAMRQHMVSQTFKITTKTTVMGAFETFTMMYRQLDGMYLGGSGRDEKGNRDQGGCG